VVEGTGYGFITEKLELGLRIFAWGITTTLLWEDWKTSNNIGLFGGFTWAGGQAGGRRSYLFGCVFDRVATFSWAFDFVFLGNESGGWSFD
jgi:hypothetical protein